MKKIRLSLLSLLAGLPLFVFAQDTGTSASFVPLTSLPGIKEFSGQASIPGLLNSIYKISIGAAAVIAVLQIMRAGIMYMGGDSVTEKREAKNLLGMTIGGLLLVLSPYIVFSIINPSILNLEIGSIELGPASGTADNSIKNTDFSDAANPAAAAKMCAAYPADKLKVIAREGDPQNVCYRKLGSGWAGVSGCCANISNDLVCCGYSESNKGTERPDPNYGTGNYSITTFERDTINNCSTDLTNKYPTAAACNTAQAGINSPNVVIIKDCAGNDINLQSARYKEFLKLPGCLP